MKTYRIFITSLLLSLFMVVSANANSYKWLDENGNVVYSQQPPAEGPYETIKTTKPSPASSRSTPAPSSSFTTEVKQEDEERELDSKVQQEAAKSEQLRAENCKAAKHNLETYTVYRRIKNDQGEIIRLDDNERAKRIQEAKDAIKEFCD
jgi:Skp family chaperone for outer membrane proteins